jgi:hypothetical protein
MMKFTRVLIAFYLVSAFPFDCLSQSVATETASAPGDAGVQAIAHGKPCAVAGVVLNAVTGAPLSKASVRLLRLAESSGSMLAVDSREAVTDSSGHFDLHVDAGRYAMAVTRVGYARQTLGMAGMAKAASVIALACGTEASQLRFSMTPQGLITGTVVDEDNEPVANAIVEAYNYRMPSRGSRVRVAAVARTDDLGKYRIFGIAAGRYYLSARAQEGPASGSSATQEKPQASYVPTYFPGTSHASAAVPIQVFSGQEIAADVALVKVPTVHASGRLMTDYRVRGVGLIVFPGDHPSWDPGERRATDADDKTGKWVFNNLQPGQYTVVCDRIDGGVRLGVRQTINVGARNLDNIEIALGRYPDLAGKVFVEGGGQVPTDMKISLQPRQAFASMGYGGAQPNPGGRFLLQAISPDLSDVMVRDLPLGYFVKSVMVAGREVSQTGVELGIGDTHAMDIVISPHGATVEGSVSDSQDQPSEGTTVVLVPEQEQRQVKGRYYTGAVDPKGHFTISGVRPGNYTVLAWDSVDTMDFMEPEALAIADKQGQALRVEEDEKKTVQLQVISTANLLP